MSLRVLLALLLCAGAAQAQPQSIWPPRPLPLAAQIGDYRQLECPKAVPEPISSALKRSPPIGQTCSTFMKVMAAAGAATPDNSTAKPIAMRFMPYPRPLVSRQ